MAFVYFLVPDKFLRNLAPHQLVGVFLPGRLFRVSLLYIHGAKVILWLQAISFLSLFVYKRSLLYVPVEVFLPG